MMHFLYNKKNILTGLLLVHVAWLSFHMIIHAKDMVSPWRLGGYAMYTVPKNDSHLWVYNLVPSQPLPAYTWQLAHENWGFNFYCKPISASSMQNFFAANPHLVGVDLRLELSTRQFNPETVQLDPRFIGKTIVVWEDETTFSYSRSMCDDRVKQVYFD